MKRALLIVGHGSKLKDGLETFDKIVNKKTTDKKPKIVNGPETIKYINLLKIYIL